MKTKKQIETVTKNERQKYETIWKQRDFSSAVKNRDFFFNCLKNRVYGKVLEIGCGTKDGLERMWHFCHYNGCDITLAGTSLLKEQTPFFKECPAWQMPYQDKEFDFTFSTDVLEHIPPEMIPYTLKEINRVTRRKTIHQIACKYMAPVNNFNVHLSVHPISWWKEQFEKYMTCDYEIFERKL